MSDESEETKPIGELLDRDGRVIQRGTTDDLVAALMADLKRPREDQSTRRTVRLREEHDGPDSRFLDAYLDGAGNLHIDGQDLGPATAIVSSDGEYEWFETIDAKDLPALRALLGGDENEDILDLLARSWSGPRAGALGQLLRDSGIDTHLSVWSG